MKASQVNQFKEDVLLQTEFENIYALLDGNIGFGPISDQRGENIKSHLVDVTASGVAADDNDITHALGRTPLGYIILSQSGSGDFYEGTGTNSDTSIFIKCTTASTRFRVAVV